jgi:hypothetical protein
MTVEGIDIKLGNGIELFGRCCQWSILPLILLAQIKRIKFSFWNEAFGFSVNDLREMKNILGKESTNLSIPQKELLLCHQRLSHVSIGWVQTLMRKKQWLKSEGANSLHSGPFIVTKNNALTFDVSWLKCAACLCSKAIIKTPDSMAPRPSQKKFILKIDNLNPGSCVSADRFYVLDAAIQDGRKIPKWNSWAQLGLFLRFSERHSTQEPLVLNVEIGKISPQHHVKFDNKFETVHLLPDNNALEKQWTMILRLGHKCFLDVDFDNNENPIVSTMSELIKANS